MGTLLQLSAVARKSSAAAAKGQGCEIIIFPGVRIERQDVDLGHRLRNTAGCERFDGFDTLGGDAWPPHSF